MDKEWFDRKHEEELPRDEIMTAIQKGMNAGRKIKRRNKMKSGMKLSAWVTGTAASVVLASGFVFSPVNTVLADVPLIGKLYGQLNLEIGKELAASNLVTEINEKASSNGVDVTVTSAFYDGNVIGVTIKAEGEDLSLEAMDKERSPETGYSLAGSDQEQLPGTRTELQKVKDGSYVAALEFELSGKELPKNYTLPLTFNLMANKKGTWKFDIPVIQLPTKKIELNAFGASKDGAHKIELRSLSVGKATATLDIMTSHPVDGVEESVNINVLDDKGRRVEVRGAGRATIVQNELLIKKQRETQLGKIEDDAEYLMVYPEVVRDEMPIIEPLNQSFPYEVSSLNGVFKAVVRNIEKKGNELVIDYEIVSSNKEKIKEDWYKQFADGINLIQTSKVIKTDDLKPQYDLLSDSPGSFIVINKSKELEKDHFRTTFNLDKVKNFNIDEYSLMLPFGNLSKDERINLEPIKVQIN
ncbi:DUF4179 domain-containing protein [Fictibacillus sp. BK138]|uniref:DUF4179 domain-containing protein n=1 Tax=Fictibacillus sp. BK138 TaxID=2512121 RepID=UPI00102887DC|nr:DUF4179 domain-containing protein [Fictibacillus sp. BK138]RZT16445.1 uncharacterized protein DUF4179 [Fictibacillus sp. BK138]